jgi:hypothetical protein
MTVQPLSSWRPPKMSASGRVFARHSPRIISRASSKMLGVVVVRAAKPHQGRDHAFGAICPLKKRRTSFTVRGP